MLGHLVVEGEASDSTLEVKASASETRAFVRLGVGYVLYCSYQDYLIVYLPIVDLYNSRRPTQVETNVRPGRNFDLIGILFVAHKCKRSSSLRADLLRYLSEPLH